MVEHHIQRQILHELMYSRTLRFSELKEDGLESNIFMYHLKQLIKGGYVEKTDKGYRLAAEGLRYVNGLSNRDLKPREQPKLLAIIAVRNSKGEWLLARRKVQPYINLLMFPSGKQHLGELILEHGLREAKEKLGANLTLSYRGIAEISIYGEDKLVTHIVAHVHFAQADLPLPPSDKRFDYVWHSFNEDSEELLPGTFDLYKELGKNQSNFVYSKKLKLK